MTGAEALVTTLARIEIARTDALAVAARLEQSRARQEAVRRSTEPRPSGSGPRSPIWAAKLQNPARQCGARGPTTPVVGSETAT